MPYLSPPLVIYIFAHIHFKASFYTKTHYHSKGTIVQEISAEKSNALFS